MQTVQGWLLLNLGMGGEILLTGRAHLPEKYRLVFDLADGACLAVNFRWFGVATDKKSSQCTSDMGYLLQ